MSAYADTLATLFALPRWADQGTAAYRPGLEKMEALMDALGRPHEAYPSVHVGGTNGKGSTASFIAAIATAGGRRVGLHTSPHLLDFAERMRIDGQPAPHAWIVEAVARHAPVFDELQPSFFEASVALSFLYFAEQGVDLAVVEVGLGGRLDATNVLTPAVAAVTYVGLDHTDVLGHTKVEIAREKAGIAKPGIRLLTAEPDAAVRSALCAETEARGSRCEAIRSTVSVEARTGEDGLLCLDISTPRRRYRDLAVGLPGCHQAWNAALAVRAVEVLEGKEGPARARTVGPESVGAVRRGIAEVRKLAGIRGRCEVLSIRPLTVVDVAHNADGLAAALAFTQARQRDLAGADPPGQLYVLLGLMRDKDLAAIVPALRHYGAQVVPVSLDSLRARAATDLRAALADLALSPDPALTTPMDPAAALAWLQARAAPRDAIVAGGSHLVAEAILRSADITSPS